MVSQHDEEALVAGGVAGWADLLAARVTLRDTEWSVMEWSGCA